MGLRRTGDGALGFAPVRIFPIAAVVLLAGCKAAPEIAAVVTGGAAGAATGSPAVGFAVGVATDAGANYAFRTTTRNWHQAEQDAIAATAGVLPVGGKADWKIEHFVPIGNEHGRLEVLRAVDSPLASCKEIAFSVDEGDGPGLQRAWFTTSICKQTKAWKWAAAEPAVERWGFLQ